MYQSKTKLETRAFTEEQITFSSSVICYKHGGCHELSCCKPRPAAAVSYLFMSLIIHHTLRTILLLHHRQGYGEDYRSSSLPRKSSTAKATAVIWFQSLTKRHESVHKVYVNTATNLIRSGLGEGTNLAQQEDVCSLTLSHSVTINIRS